MTLDHSSTEPRVRIVLRLRGRVQGVGFRPFVYRTAVELGISGWVRNDTQGVVLEAEGCASAVKTFKEKVIHGVPAPARVDDWHESPCALSAETGFAIVKSDATTGKMATILPEIATCTDCQREIAEPHNRRYQYPFTNCTHCGPRFTIVRELPYDRPNTTMAGFVMCADCQREYDDPHDRRFHAQPNACPVCGPELFYYADASRKAVARREQALALAARDILQGRIVAIQGLGGFHLIVDATNDTAVRELRLRKHRWEKPLAVMLQGVPGAREHVVTDSGIESLLQSPEAPIVLCRKLSTSKLAPSVAPDTPWLGIMLAATPLHHLLLEHLQRPIVATSGNLSEEPICIDPVEAIERLGGIADTWLVHNRPIERHMDDSVVHLIHDTPQFLRRARGYAPLPVAVPDSTLTVLALGGHQKNTIALALRDRVFISQHIGDLDSLQTRQACVRVVRDFLRLYAATPDVVAHDLHPDYASSHIAEQLTEPGGLLAGVPRQTVQHHHAHLAACLGDAEQEGPALGVIWDGSGLGLDSTLWGSEFLLGDASEFTRIAALRPYPLLGGEAAARDPRRAALSLLAITFGVEVFEWADLPCVFAVAQAERKLLARLFEGRINCPLTSSMGRLFDAVAALCGLVTRPGFEGRPGMLLESQVADVNVTPYPLPVVVNSDHTVGDVGRPRYWLEPRPLIENIVADVRGGVGPAVIAARFHVALVTSVIEVAHLVVPQFVVLSGGCFQNRLLTEGCITQLRKNGLKAVIHRYLPPNDGGLSLGQALVARALQLNSSSAQPLK